MLALLTTFLLASAPASDGSSPSNRLADIGPAPAFELVDETGRSFTSESLRGKVVLVSFIYTTCTGSCPATTLNLAEVQRVLKEAGLWGKRVEFVSISLDPRRDTPEVLARYAQLYRADTARWHFLTGSPGRVAEVLAAWDMWARVDASGVLNHPSRIFLVDPRGHQREIYNLEFLRPKAVLEDVKLLLREHQAGADRGRPERPNPPR